MPKNSSFPLIPVIIPCYNEIDNLNRLIPRFKPLSNLFVPILVDNGSTDGSGAFARKNSWIVVYEKLLGYGYACKKGIQYVLRNFKDVQFIAFFDADFSEDPEDLILLFQTLIQKRADLVIGSRKAGFHRMEAPTRNANIVFTYLLKLFFRINLRDNGPMRIISKETLQSLDMKDNFYGWTFEMTIKAVKKRKKVLDIPVTYLGRLSGKSKISGNFKNALKAGIQINFLMFKYIFLKG
jgi:glycosyltransferase involved in cell wall biosynthesis